MQPLCCLFLAVFLCACGNSAPGPASPPTTDPSPVGITSPVAFDPGDCTFLPVNKVAELLGEGVSGVTEAAPSFVAPGSCGKIFEVTLEDGRSYRMQLDASPIPSAGMAQEMRSFEEEARDIPGLTKYEASAAPGTFLGTHVSQRRLYVLHPDATHLITLSYDDRTAGGSQSPEESEDRRLGAIRVINYFLIH